MLNVLDSCISMNSKGFTLIELVVVIVILGILSVTAAPKFLNVQSDAKKSSLDGFIGAYKAAEGIVEGKALLEGYNFESEEVIEVGKDKVKIKLGSVIPENENLKKVMNFDGYKVVEYRPAEQTLVLPSTYKGKAGLVSIDDFAKATVTACYVAIERGKEGDTRTKLIRNYNDC